MFRRRAFSSVLPKAQEWPTEAGVPPLEALPAPVEEVLRQYQTTLTLTHHLGPALFTRARDVQTGLPGESEWWDIKESEYLALGRVGRAVDAAARDLAREAAQLEKEQRWARSRRRTSRSGAAG